MITVAGGVYVERCIHPHWDQLFGSGGRAAAALSQRGSVELHAYCDSEHRPELEARMRSFQRVKLFPTACEKTVEFDYVHTLSVPFVSPPIPRIRQHAPLSASGDVVLRFGMLEGSAKVEGERVVYDPQSVYNPESFRANRSTAGTLAIVASGYEVKLLTGDADPESGALKLAQQEGADVVVAKLGSRGAVVASSAGAQRVPPFESKSVFSLGSGDVFASAFAYYWGLERMGPVDAARLSSKTTARYCESRSPYISPKEDIEGLAMREMSFREGRVYLAGPFFNIGQRWLVEEARAHLKNAGLKVFSPVHDVGPGPAEVVAPADLEALHDCDRVLALVDGADAGTLFEVGYARARDIPVVALAECLSEEELKMILGSGCEVVRDLATAIYKTAWVRA